MMAPWQKSDVGSCPVKRKNFRKCFGNFSGMQNLKMHFFFFEKKENRGREAAWWICALELSTASTVSDQSHQHSVWTRRKEWFCLLGMSEGPDNYIWQSHEEWLSNVIAKNYPLIAFLDVWAFQMEWHSISAVTVLSVGLLPRWSSCSFLPSLWYQFSFSSIFLLPRPVSLPPLSVPTVVPTFPVLEM